jgi:hypothetical protein
MKNRNVIKSNNLRSRSPILGGLVFYLALDKWNAAEWIYGAVGLLLIVWLIAFIADRFNTTEIDIFSDDDKDTAENRNKSFQERLKEKASGRS